MLIVAGSPSPELQFMRNALLRDPAIEMACWLQSAGENYEQVGTSSGAAPAGQSAGAFVFRCRRAGRSEHEETRPRLGRDVDEIHRRCRRRADLCCRRAVHQQDSSKPPATLPAHADTSWLAMLPVVWESGLYQSTADVRLNARDTWNLELTADGNDDPIFHFSPDPGKNREILASLPGMYWHFPGDPREARRDGARPARRPADAQPVRPARTDGHAALRPRTHRLHRLSMRRTAGGICTNSTSTVSGRGSSTA